MSEMLDRLEAVIREAFKDEKSFVSQMDVIWVRDESFGFRPRVLAKSMLEAMREPTEAMYDAGNCTFDFNTSDANGCDYPQKADAEVCWQAMVDKALSP